MDLKSLNETRRSNKLSVSALVEFKLFIQFKSDHKEQIIYWLGCEELSSNVELFCG